MIIMKKSCWYLLSTLAMLTNIACRTSNDSKSAVKSSSGGGYSGGYGGGYGSSPGSSSGGNYGGVGNSGYANSGNSSSPGSTSGGGGFNGASNSGISESSGTSSGGQNAQPIIVITAEGNIKTMQKCGSVPKGRIITAAMGKVYCPGDTSLKNTPESKQMDCDASGDYCEFNGYSVSYSSYGIHIHKKD